MALLSCLQLDKNELDWQSTDWIERTLGIIRVGSAYESGIEGIPLQLVNMPLLGSDKGMVSDVWLAGGACRSGGQNGLSYRYNGHVLFAVLTLDEHLLTALAGSLPLQRATEQAYERLFRLLDEQGYPYLWRVWNYLADINVEEGGLERYRQFNVGRQLAYEKCGRAVGGYASAACALGTAAGPLTVAVMAGKTAPVLLENPRQVRACDYPSVYGPRSPVFSRAALAKLPGQELLFISGTASIVGHRTMHVGDVAAQTRETLANIAAVLQEANRVAPGLPFTLSQLSYRTYIRHAADLDAVRAEVQRQVGGAQVQYVQADVCRSDLLVEIEAMASRTAEQQDAAGVGVA